MSLNSMGLDAFYACSQEKNVTRAAVKLSITQSALSQRLKNLEDDLGVTLFIREKTGMRLTLEGEELLRYCEARSQFETEIRQRITTGDELGGVIRIGGFSSVNRSVILPALQDLLAKNPQIKLDMITAELHELPELLRSGQVDFLILDKKLDKDGVISEVLGQETQVRVRRKDSAFNGHFLDHDENDRTSLEFMKVKKIEKRHFLGDIYALIDGVKMGLGDAIIPKHLVTDKNIEIVKGHSVKTAVCLNHYERPFYTALFKCVKQELTRRVPDFLA